ncbi:MAG: bifunctional diaminohydroxyphosphoribosylaminopyrimidine deaminase/5-amino-6-(5-phosphoribosylamino)uracil reductase RibD [Verrucomicrobiaceae bacterium]
MSTDDLHWMTLALEEAKQGIGLTSPNPAVGCVLVRDGRELARGWHQQAGTNHAERDALSKVDDAKGATAYVTLEPCSSHGNTGACTDALITAGITRVVYAIPDPNPHHVGRADDVLRAAGIDVSSGLLEEECHHLIRGFAMVQTQNRPWVIAKTAMSLDGKITRPPGEGQWLTGPEAREDVQLLRAEVDAIITSGETVRRDNPSLTLRSPAISPRKKQPLRVILTRSEIDQSAYQIFHDDHPTRLFQNLPISEVLRTLADDGINTVLLESGGNLMGSFLDEGLIDEFVIYYAPLVTGGPTPAIGGEGAANLEERQSLKNTTLTQIGPDLRLRGILDRNGPRPLER